MKTFIIAGLIALCIAVVAANSCHDLRAAAINAKLANVTAPGNGALFAVLKRPIGPVRPHDFKIYTHGAISASNSIRAGSITKIFTGYFGLTNGVELDESPRKYGFLNADYPQASILRYGDLYGQKSGIHEFTTAIGYNETTNQFIPPVFTVPGNIDLGWKHIPLDFAPGSQYCYSNTNFEIIGETVLRKTGRDIKSHIHAKFGSIAPSMTLDNGSIPVGGWPAGEGYQDWPYPASLPGVSGTLIGRPADIMTAFDKIIRDRRTYNVMQQWNDNPKCNINPGASIAAGDSYGNALQRYDSVFAGPAVGHDGDLIVRTILLHIDDHVFLFHYTSPMDNPVLVKVASDLIKIVLSN